jgi:predicted ArsR family transcriptional regulator
MGQGLIERHTARTGRGRPSHEYSLTEKGRRETGDNYGDLALTLWNEIRSIKDPEIRRGLLQRIATGLAARYTGRVSGETLGARMTSLVEVLGERKIPFAVDESGELPVLTALACPYPDLAEQDRGVCAMEKMLFSELLGEGLKLTECRLDGANCCTFETA